MAGGFPEMGCKGGDVILLCAWMEAILENVAFPWKPLNEMLCKRFGVAVTGIIGSPEPDLSS